MMQEWDDLSEAQKEVAKIARRLTTASQYEKYLPNDVQLLIEATAVFLAPLLTFIPIESRDAMLDFYSGQLRGFVATLGVGRKSDA